MRDEALRRLQTSEAIQALLEGRDRRHNLLEVRKSHLSGSWWDREKQVICSCGWYAFVLSRRQQPERVWRSHFESESSRAPKQDQPDAALSQVVAESCDFLLAGSYPTESEGWHAVGLLNRIDAEYHGSLARRPPSVGPMPQEQYMSSSDLKGDSAE
jgi:hypothetical protein